VSERLLAIQEKLCSAELADNGYATLSYNLGLINYLNKTM